MERTLRAGHAATRTSAPYRVRTPDDRPPSVGVTPPGVRLRDGGHRVAGSGPAHGRPRSRLGDAARLAGATLTVFVLALLLVTGLEVVLGHTLSGGPEGHTTLGDVLHPRQ